MYGLFGYLCMCRWPGGAQRPCHAPTPEMTRPPPTWFTSANTDLSVAVSPEKPSGPATARSTGMKARPTPTNAALQATMPSTVSLAPQGTWEGQAWVGRQVRQLGRWAGHEGAWRHSAVANRLAARAAGCEVVWHAPLHVPQQAQRRKAGEGAPARLQHSEPLTSKRLL